MAELYPLVISPTDGLLEEIQSGDTLNPNIIPPLLQEATNSNASAITIGQPVYVDGAGSVDLADASARTTSNVVGLVYDASIATTATGNIMMNDGAVLTSADWTAVVGSTTLTAGAEYFLSETAGQLTTTPVTTSGGVVVLVGIAVSTTELKFIGADAMLGVKRR